MTARRVVITVLCVTGGCVGSGRSRGASEPGDPADSGSAPAETGPGSTPDGSEVPAGGYLIEGIDNLCLYLNLGESMAAGFNATTVSSSPGYFHCQASERDCANYGWARLLFENRSLGSQDNSAYDGHDLLGRFPGAQMYNQASSGDTSADVIVTLRRHIDSMPACAGLGEDVIVTLGAGGNDFNDAMETMTQRTVTERVADGLAENYDGVFQMLKARYDAPAEGRRLIVLATNVYDPTGGTGDVPSSFTADFCTTLHSPVLTPEVRQTAVGNLEYFNGRMREVIERNGGVLVDHHAIFMCHGMNSGDARWLDDDCTHPNDAGHHGQRRLLWSILTGELYGGPLQCP